MRTRLAVSVAIAASVAGCGDDGPSGPSTPSVAGNWIYEATKLTDSTSFCSFREVPMTLAQSGTTFSGAYAGGVLSCIGPIGNFYDTVAGGAVSSGRIDGSSVRFDLDNPGWRNTGTVSGSSMSGTVTVSVLIPGVTTIILTGDFNASRQ